MSRPRVLVVDDESSQRSAVAHMIERWGFETDTASDGMEALHKIQAHCFDALITDLMMPGMDGIELLRRLRDDSPIFPPAIVLTGYGNIETAITTVHEHGAFWFVEKPIRPRAFRVLLERAIAQHRLLENSERLQRELSSYGVLGKLVGSSAPMQEVFFLIRQAAPTRANVLITGESGTGKELAARAIHDLSSRRSGPFIAVNCAAIPDTLLESELFGNERGAFTGAWSRRPGCIELAHRGTLLLDEIGDMPISAQAKFLRVIEERRVRRLGGSNEIDVDVRIVACTNRDLQEAAHTGAFREDLFFRLSVLHIAMPPLRNRIDDLPLLCGALLRDLNEIHESRVINIGSAAMEALRLYAWPGNVRELRNVLERTVILAREGEIGLSQLPPNIVSMPQQRPQRTLGPVPTVILPVGATIAQAERELIELTLLHTRHNQTKAAEMLGITAKTLYNKLRDYGSKTNE